MRILAIETSTQRGSLALLEQGELVREVVVSSNRRIAQSLAPAMAGLLERAGWTPQSIDLVAVTKGPGSFTGLRIAVTTAKTFAYATGAELIALNTLRVLVEQLPPGVSEACAVMDAQRRQLFAARFRRVPESAWTESAACQIVDRGDLAGWLSPTTVVTGPALDRLPRAFLAGCPMASADRWMPRAGTVGRLAALAYQAGQRDDVFRLEPQYYRPSYAEEKSG